MRRTVNLLLLISVLTGIFGLAVNSLIIYFGQDRYFPYPGSGQPIPGKATGRQFGE
jgi:hypothetical protein